MAQQDACKAVLQALEGQSIDLLVVAAGCQELDTVDSVTRDCIRRQFEVNALGPLFAVLDLQPNLSKGAKVAPCCKCSDCTCSSAIPPLNVAHCTSVAHTFFCSQVAFISSKNGSITEVDATGGELVSGIMICLSFLCSCCCRASGHALHDLTNVPSTHSGYANVQDATAETILLGAVQYGYRMAKVALNMAGVTLARDWKKRDIAVALIHPGVVSHSWLKSTCLLV